MGTLGLGSTARVFSAEGIETIPRGADIFSSDAVYAVGFDPGRVVEL